MKLISIHAAREGGDPLCIRRSCGLTISIHAAREGGDPLCIRRSCGLTISIHAAREGGDGGIFPRGTRQGYFNPRRP